ncbi:GNAT family N-acetyltransferase [Mucilaginibacter sp. X4EP1]|uniref:GNAT family N-acetyltransferase n=1 Tax=Mucilaginibacter sp. X4EP1 TaxID=2723092 RepID=UPI00216A0F36|nr:GNAT family protein [Mucilaginibacter sp. X4EP1]MCS3813953.1 RimJ/RimL family protein N-acetyltransferase [Mucilaginibacter sp. X4EP1]
MELQGQGFKLRNWKLEDIESLQKHADNPNISCFLWDRFPNPYTKDDAIKWTALMLKQNPLVNFAIDINGEAVGAISLEPRPDVYAKAPLLGYWLSESFWGRGIMPRAIKLVTNYAFTSLGAIRVQAIVFGNNPQSMRVLEKAGFTKEGVLRNNVIKNGVVLDEHVYGMLKG